MAACRGMATGQGAPLLQMWDAGASTAEYSMPGPRANVRQSMCTLPLLPPTLAKA